jgi:hypothetical protein
MHYHLYGSFNAGFFFFFLASEVPGADRHQKKYVEIKFKSRHYLKSSQSSLKNVGVENSN